MNRINLKLQENKKLLSIYFTAGFPNLNDTVAIIQELEKSGVDMIEIGLPFSDPLADGPTIQESSTKALENGMTTKLLFEQLKDIRKSVTIPLLIMGYFNPILQFGVEHFCEKCAEVGIDGLIIPDLPLTTFEEEYKTVFEHYNLKNIFLITPQTAEERIRKMDSLSDSFIYMVSSSSTTGSQNSFGDNQKNYFDRIAKMELKNPQIVGFGISDKATFQQAIERQKGAIIGSDFVKFISQNNIANIQNYINNLFI
ncbi:tryptophan synthase alpha chain [Flavobacterium cauense R2A-7]|uniref:Tryptophan synthase alpha chain n=1 Tax=Flavobacterium cauense R2A-7 TaxID=1341154 RepID=V6RXD9_9FLAO|nr:tryptophan synthase subunit alpha [Flavobacterium cauense]ESU19146.1 tryptophan synthase alpha chain [Flavobacterium cauense R2A-7]KGO82226.1 tryptophan synthase alpha chain [Flavobacterium cauense R2A-7]TWI15182.1 tryptophan synthase alpha chain [Flavobacterium cauense R2A-7]